MKLLGEMMRRDPNPDERDALDAVVEIALAWQRGEIDLRGVRSATTGHDRWQAMRFAALGSEGKRALMALVDALVAEDPNGMVTTFGIMDMQEVYQPGVKKVTNHAGDRVVLWPMHWIHGEPVYPQVQLPPGEERRKREEAAMLAYKDYRKGKKPISERARWEDR